MAELPAARFGLQLSAHGMLTRLRGCRKPEQEQDFSGEGVKARHPAPLGRPLRSVDLLVTDL